jgi:hypothetical protein
VDTAEPRIQSEERVWATRRRDRTAVAGLIDWLIDQISASAGRTTGRERGGG